MVPNSVPQRKNVVYTGYEHPEVGSIRDLGVYRSPAGVLYSTWRPGWGDRLRLLLGQPIVVGVLAVRQPPMCVAVGEETIDEIEEGFKR